MPVSWFFDPCEFVIWPNIYTGIQPVWGPLAQFWYLALGPRLISARVPLAMESYWSYKGGPFPVKGTPDNPVMGACYLVNRSSWSSLNAASSCVPFRLWLLCYCIRLKHGTCSMEFMWELSIVGYCLSAALRHTVEKLFVEPLL